MDEEDYPETVTDSKSAVYCLIKKIGEGGQGAVFATGDGQMAVKLIAADQSDTAQLAGRIDRIGALPLLWNLPLSRPVTAIKPEGRYTGYVMDLLTDMMPIEWLMLPEEPIYEEEQFVKWYVVETGGLRRRLRILARAAETIAALHSVGLCFGDPSAANILVSAANEGDVVWLIDPDNIGVTRKAKGSTPSDLGTPVARNTYTAGYCAPEVLRKESGTNTLTDVYGFAIIACKALTTIHPFQGDFVNDAPPDELTKANRGEHPWIGDEEDQSNSCTRGVPLDTVLTKRLRSVAQQTFGAGRKDPLERPGVSEWADALFAAADLTIACPVCSGTYYPIKDGKVVETCFWCEAKQRRFGLLRLTRWVPTYYDEDFKEEIPGGPLGERFEIGYGVISDPAFLVSRRIAFGESGLDYPDAHKGLIELQYLYDRDALRLAPTSDKNEFWITHKSSGSTPLKTALEVPWSSAPIWLHFGPEELAHRCASIRLV
jgi:DNA-binding helix-hairpin-helix protein with protein kinase domain